MTQEKTHWKNYSSNEFNSYLCCMEKLCNKCQVVKDVSEFQKEARAKNGYKPRCKVCTNEYYRSKYATIKTNKSKQQKKYYIQNKEAKKKSSREYYERNKPARIKYNLKYIGNRRKVDLEFRLMLTMRKNLLRIKVDKNQSTLKILGYNLDQLILSLGNLPEKNEVIDHKIPISWFIAGATPNIVHHLDNLQILTREDNSKKGASRSDKISKRYLKLAKPFIKKDKIKLIKT